MKLDFDTDFNFKPEFIFEILSVHFKLKSNKIHLINNLKDDDEHKRAFRKQQI